MGLISRLTSDIQHNERVLKQLERGGNENSDAAKTARDRIRTAERKLANAEEE